MENYNDYIEGLKDELINLFNDFTAELEVFELAIENDEYMKADLESHCASFIEQLTAIKEGTTGMIEELEAQMPEEN